MSAQRARISGLVFLFLAVACEQRRSGQTAEVVSKQAAPTESSLKDTAGVAAVVTSRLAIIRRFDCVEHAANDPSATAPDWSQGLREWSAGGPGGATWNADQLRCVAEIETICADGRLDAEFRVGGTLVAERSEAISRAGLQVIAVDLSQQSWLKHLDQAGAKSKSLPYQTASFGLAVQARCSNPIQLGPGVGPRHEYADEAYFAAGFASGE